MPVPPLPLPSAIVDPRVGDLGPALLALAGLINPLIAAVLMPASSLTVVLASWLGRTFEAPAP